MKNLEDHVFHWPLPQSLISAFSYLILLLVFIEQLLGINSVPFYHLPQWDLSQATSFSASVFICKIGYYLIITRRHEWVNIKQ